MLARASNLCLIKAEPHYFIHKGLFGRHGMYSKIVQNVDVVSMITPIGF